MAGKVWKPGVCGLLVFLLVSTSAGIASANRAGMRELRKRAESGDAAAEAELGMRYYAGTGVRKNGDKARHWMLLAADHGDARAQFNAGTFFETGVGGDKDFEQAIEWYGRAEASGFEQAREARLNAIVNLGYALETGQGMPRDFARAATLYREAAEGGDATAQFNLGLLLTAGKGVDRDYIEAGRWLRAADDQGYSGAPEALEGLREIALIVPEDAPALTQSAPTPSAREGAAAGDADSQFQLALMLRVGLDVERDERESARWMIAAAEQGHPVAQAELALMHHAGEGVPQDYELAAAWYLKSAEQGNSRAQSSLGAMLVNGEGIPVDMLEGLKWTYISYAAQHMSRYMIFRLERELDEGTFAKGRRLADAWFAAHDLPPTRYGPVSEWQAR